MGLHIEDRLQLAMFGIAGLTCLIILLVDFYARIKRQEPLISLLPALLVGAILCVFAALSAYHNKSGESLPWLFSSELVDRGLFEWLTAICLLGTSFYAIRLLPHTRGLQRVGFGFLAVACFFIAGEEMSWGQWIFGWETPEQLSEINLQNETNVHNLVNPRVYDFLYYAIGYAALILTLIGYWLFTETPDKDAQRSTLSGLLSSAGGWLRGNSVALVIVLAAATLIQHELLEEYAESVFALGMLLFLLHHYRLVYESSRTRA